MTVKSFAMAAAVALAAVCRADEVEMFHQGAVGPGGSCKVLMIGNSFSISCLSHLPKVAAANGHKLDLASLYIGGCSLERHCRNIEDAADGAAFRPYRFDRVVDGEKVVEKGSANIPDALAMDKWDVVTIQQASHLSWDKSSYRPWGDRLVEKIRALAPQAKVLVQETWSYPPWDKRLGKFGFDQLDMYAKLHDAYREFAGRHGFGIIPAGTAAEFCPDRNSLFTRPDFHFNREEGEYLQALVWDMSLFGFSDDFACTYRPAGMTATRAIELAEAAAGAHLRVAGEAGGAWRASESRAFREPRVTRSNTNILKLQPIDDASWIWAPKAEGTPAVLKFRREFDVEEGDGTLVVDVSADERFYLTLDGRFMARGPNRGSVENWQYQTYLLDALKPGRHVFEAVVTRLGDDAPLAQLSCRGGFILKANGAYDAKLTTGKAKWQVGRMPGIKPTGSGNGVWGTGSQFEISGRGPYAGEPESWTGAVVVRSGAGAKGPRIVGLRTKDWMLFPSQLPDQTEFPVRPGEFRAATHDAKWREEHCYSEAETNAAEVAGLNGVLDYGRPFAVPARTRLQAAWDLGRYTCAYPVLATKGGKGSRISWTWAESARNAGKHNHGRKGDRSRIVGMYLDGYGDVFAPDGGEGEFSTPWFRCGKWCRIDIETGDEPLEITGLAMMESRYPLEMESEFYAPDLLDSESAPDLAVIRRICERAMQMCCHEMLFDCPYYEQQMYPGDTRVQLNVISAMTRDDRIVKRAIEMFDLATRDDGMCPMNYPTRGIQESLTYTLCYLCMYGDYTMNHTDREWLRARLPGLRKSMAGVEYYENAEGLLENVPGWCFIDWTTGWEPGGTAPSGRYGEGVNAEINLFWVLAMQSAALTERALGNDLQAEYWERKCAALKRRIVDKFWSADRELLADTPSKRDFSEHAQALAIAGDVLPADKRESAFRHLVEDADLKRCTVYFSYYLFDAYFKMGRGDLFLEKLSLWQGYADRGLTTLLEAPDAGKNGQKEPRSDCHAWGAHPIWFMQTGLAGIKSAAPFFEKVLVEPCPGGQSVIIARHPHPKGWIAVDLRFKDGKAEGTISTPVPGVFVFGDVRKELQKGNNTL